MQVWGEEEEAWHFVDAARGPNGKVGGGRERGGRARGRGGGGGRGRGGGKGRLFFPPPPPLVQD